MGMQLTGAVFAWDEVEPSLCHPKVNPIAEPGYSRDVKQRCDRPGKRQPPGDPPKRRIPGISPSAIRRNDMHLFEQSFHLQLLLGRRPTAGVPAVLIRELVK